MLYLYMYLYLYIYFYLYLYLLVSYLPCHCVKLIDEPCYRAWSGTYVSKRKRKRNKWSRILALKSGVVGGIGASVAVGTTQWFDFCKQGGLCACHINRLIRALSQEHVVKEHTEDNF